MSCCRRFAARWSTLEATGLLGLAVSPHIPTSSRNPPRRPRGAKERSIRRSSAGCTRLAIKRRRCAMREWAPQIVHEIEDWRWSAAWRTQARQRGHAAALAMPLLTDDQCLGVLEVYTDDSAAFEMAEVVLLNEIAADLAFGVVTMRTRREYQRQKTDIALLTRVLRMQSAINSAVLRIRDPNSLLEEACRVAVEVGCYNSAVVWLVEPGTRIARPGYRTGGQVPDVAPKRLHIGDNERDTSLTARAMRTGEVSVCCDLTRSDQPLIGRELLFADGVRLVVVLPFMVDGVPVGALTLTSKDSSQVGDIELLLLQ